MTNLMQNAATWLGGKLKTAAGRSVSIQQGTTTLTGLTAWMSLNTVDVIDGEGFMTRVDSADWSFAAADLGTLEIRPGAVITDVDTGDKYESMMLGNKPCTDGGTDTSGIILTVHTKKVE